ncbi:MAG: methyltransferase domain-containing protein [Kofleriaceae bacterium]
MRSLSIRDRAEYFGRRAAWFAIGGAFNLALRRAIGVKTQPPSRATLNALRRRFVQLVTADLRNVEHGFYPRELVARPIVPGVMRVLPKLIRDAPHIVARKRRGDFKDLPSGLEGEEFPPYYRRNFHWQTDGYFSEHSAAIYEASVELLFRGSADVMRRQVIPHLTRPRAAGERIDRILDVGTGTGGFLELLAAALPGAELHGVDLSPAYVAAASRRLGPVGATLTCGNAEQLPFADASFDAITSVYLFHELPRRARRNVVREAYRALRRGGLLVIEDSSQYADAPELREVLDAFPREFHEPYYLDYLGDSLPELVHEIGFEVLAHESHMVSVVVAARKPLSRSM